MCILGLLIGKKRAKTLSSISFSLSFPLSLPLSAFLLCLTCYTTLSQREKSKDRVCVFFVCVCTLPSGICWQLTPPVRYRARERTRKGERHSMHVVINDAAVTSCSTSSFSFILLSILVVVVAILARVRTCRFSLPLFCILCLLIHCPSHSYQTHAPCPAIHSSLSSASSKLLTLA